MTIHTKFEELSDYGLGRIVDTKTNLTVVYQPYEVSRCLLGILTTTDLSTGGLVRLQANNGRPLNFIVKEASKEVDKGYNRYQLRCLDRSIDVEQILIYSGCHKKFESISDARIQASRYPTDPPIKIIANTFGTPDKFQLRTCDISKTGMLIESTSLTRVPFIKNTLLELYLPNAGAWLSRSITAIGKITRRHNSDESHKERFGLEIIELDSSAPEVWSETLSFLAQKN